MKKILLGVLLAGTAMSAQAADLAVKAPYYKAPMATIYDWTGFYVGANAGVGLGRNRAIQDGGSIFGTTSTYVSPLGGLGGGQIGYNWQTNGTFLGPIVFGVEADIQGSDLSDSYPNLLGLQYSQKLDWFGTVRGRVGLATGPVLTYLTAGYAYGNVRTNVIEGPATFSTGSSGRSGWTWGSGVEAALGGNWTGKIEYLWLDLGDNNYNFTLGGTPQALRTELRENIFRVGLNYRIGGNSTYTPVVAANWAGFYLGGNIGSGSARDRSTITDVGAGTSAFLNTAPDGINGGVQAGYNWQAGNWVYGLETDIQGSAQEDNKTCLGCGGTTLNVNSKLPWFGTARGRLGYSIGSSLFYATGGFAYGSIKTSLNDVSVTNDTRTGWTVGAGIETPFTLLGLFGPNWTTKTEYLYVDLGRSTNDFTLNARPGVYTTDVKEHIFRTGLNYHFNTPVVARY